MCGRASLKPQPGKRSINGLRAAQLAAGFRSGSNLGVSEVRV